MKSCNALWMIGLTFSLAGCLAKSSRDGLSPSGQGSVLASITGIEDEDRDNDKTEFKLVCDGGVEVKASKIIKGSNGEEFLQFDGKQIKDGNSCSMEVWNQSLVNDPSYVWYAKKEGQAEPVRGFLYGSNKSIVEKRSLDLTIHKAYAKKDVPTFVAGLTAAFEGEALLSQDKLSAWLFCGPDKQVSSYQADAIQYTEATRQAVLTFQYLPVADLTGQTCSTLRVMQTDVGSDGKEVQTTYMASLSDVSFAGDQVVAAGKRFDFPAAGVAPYQLKLETDGPIEVTIAADECFNILLGADKCSDARNFNLPFAKNYLVAYVKGRTDNGRGEPREYVVGVGENGFGALNSTTFSIDMLNKALASDDALVQKTFGFWKGGTQIVDDIRDGKLLTNAMISGDRYVGSKMEHAALQGVKLLHVESLWVHGFHEVADLAQEQGPASWMAVVEAKKDANVQTFVVGGADRGFVSAQSPLFRFEDFVADAQDSNLQQFQAFQNKEALGTSSSCALTSVGDIIGEASHAVVSETDAVGAKLSACKAAVAPMDAASSYTVTVKGFRLGWKKLAANP